MLDDDVEQRRAAERFSECPCAGLVDGHERRLDRHWPIETECQRVCERLQRIIAAIGIT